jgi:NAD(P)-dependent dehydrogenase (short-subunit alcohol dehydrogenase family)
MRGLEGKVVVVVAGGSRPDRPSLGGATSLRLAQEGATVVVADINLEAAQQTVAAITSGGGTAVAVECDVSNETSIAATFGFAVDTFGGVDGVHSNAMDMSPETLGADGQHDICTLPLDVWQRTLDVGLTGFFLVARQAIPLLVERGGGGIVGTASGAVFAGESVRLGYATAKTGMTAIIRHIASSYGPRGVRANLVAPGVVLSPQQISDMPPEMVTKWLRVGRSNRMGTADDIAGAVTFLLSDDGSWMNGQIVSVDGGTILGR